MFCRFPFHYCYLIRVHVGIAVVTIFFFSCTVGHAQNRVNESLEPLIVRLKVYEKECSNCMFRFVFAAYYKKAIKSHKLDQL